MSGRAIFGAQAQRGLRAAIDCGALLHNVADNRLASRAKSLRCKDLRTPVGREVRVIQVPLPQNLTLTPEQVEQLRQMFQAERARAYLWEYRYLNYFLVPQTQRVLDWLASLKEPPSYELYDTMLIPAIPSAEERKAIVEALQGHHLIQIKGNLLVARSIAIKRNLTGGCSGRRLALARRCR